MFKYIIAAAVVYFVFFNESDKPHAVSFQTPEVQKLYEEAKFFTKFVGDIEPPKIIPSTPKELQKMYCGGNQCSVSAIYYRGNIYYDNSIELNDTVNRSIIVHELVHHIQNHQYGPTYDCDLWYKKEQQAYQVQSTYLKLHGHSDKIIKEAIKGLTCPT
jgi:hypothetical protein